jgi:hypothetical protein
LLRAFAVKGANGPKDDNLLTLCTRDVIIENRVDCAVMTADKYKIGPVRFPSIVVDVLLILLLIGLNGTLYICRIVKNVWPGHL